MKVLTSDGPMCREVAPNELTTRLSDPTRLTWIDITDPGPADLDFLRDEFQIHELALEDVAKRRQRPKVDRYGDYYYVVMYPLGPEAESFSLHQLDIFVGPNYLVTLHQGPVIEVTDTQKRWQDHPSAVAQEPSHLLYRLLDAIIDRYFPFVDDLSDRVDNLEEKILQQSSRDVLGQIFALRKEMMQLRRVLAPEREVLNALLRRDDSRINEDWAVYFQDLYDHVLRIIDQVDTFRDLLTSALDAHLANTSNRLNEVMKRLTSYATILMSVTLVAGIYGMNFKGMPELEWPFGYPYALALMVAIALVLFWYFKRADWL